MAAERAGAGYFPPGSILRRVHEQRAVGLMYGQRALGVGAISPLNFTGTLLHTRAPERPFQRLARTGKAFETIFFGSREQADRVLASVRRLHSAVRGELPEAAGPVPAGTPYSAFDPELMLWTIAVMADSALRFYELFVGRLEAEERDGFWRDYVRFGELFGMPAAAAPRTYPEFADYMRARIEGGDAHLTERARYLGAAIMFEIPVPAHRRPGLLLHNLVMAGSLPPRVRDLYGLRWDRSREAGFRAAVAATRPRGFVPRRFRIGPNGDSFDLVARTEAARIAAGRRTPGISLSTSG